MICSIRSKVCGFSITVSKLQLERTSPQRSHLHHSITPRAAKRHRQPFHFRRGRLHDHDVTTLVIAPGGHFESVYSTLRNKHIHPQLGIITPGVHFEPVNCALQYERFNVRLYYTEFKRDNFTRYPWHSGKIKRYIHRCLTVNLGEKKINK